MIANKKKASPKVKEARKKVALDKAAKGMSADDIQDILRQVKEATQ